MPLSDKPFDTNQTFYNDLNDFKMPYRLYGQTDLDVMIDKYLKLHNSSYGLIVRIRHN